MPTSASGGDPPLYDLRGLKCPLPVLKTGKRMALLPAGARLLVETDDPMAAIDMPHYCNQNGHRLLRTVKTPAGHRFLIEKAIAPE